jgi:membrane protease YdiL (CAAX protease family)
MQAKRTLQKHPALTFFALTYAFSWGMVLAGLRPELSFLTWLGSYGPALVAILLSAVLFGNQGLMDLLQRIFRWRVGLRWYLAAFLIPLVIVILGVVLYPLTVEDWPNRPDWIAIFPRLVLAIFSFTLVAFMMLLGEEIGWRGFAQPHLLTRYSPLVTSLVIGVAWGVWHLPIMWLREPDMKLSAAMIFTLETTLISLAYTWLYKETQGSLVVITLLHTFYDAIGYTFLWLVPVKTDSLLLLALHALVAGAALLLGGVRWFWQRPKNIS